MPAPTASASVRRCHYCPAEATTRDHIVPRALRLRLPPDNHTAVTVPACHRCNQIKGAQRAACTCATCAASWAKYGPPGWESLPVIDVAAAASRRRLAPTSPASRPARAPAPLPVPAAVFPAGDSCHYCPAPAAVSDCIVPRARRSPGFQVNPQVRVTVPARRRCVQIKGNSRTACTCVTCEVSWVCYGPAGWASWPTIDVTAIAADQDRQHHARAG